MADQDTTRESGSIAATRVKSDRRPKPLSLRARGFTVCLLLLTACGGSAFEPSVTPRADAGLDAESGAPLEAATWDAAVVDAVTSDDVPQDATEEAGPTPVFSPCDADAQPMCATVNSDGVTEVATCQDGHCTFACLTVSDNLACTQLGGACCIYGLDPNCAWPNFLCRQ